MKVRSYESGGDGRLRDLTILGCLELRVRHMTDGLEQLVGFEPGHPFQVSQFDRHRGLPKCAPTNELGLVQPFVILISALS